MLTSGLFPINRCHNRHNCGDRPTQKSPSMAVTLHNVFAEFFCFVLDYYPAVFSHLLTISLVIPSELKLPNVVVYCAKFPVCGWNNQLLKYDVSMSQWSLVESSVWTSILCVVAGFISVHISSL